MKWEQRLGIFSSLTNLVYTKSNFRMNSLLLYMHLAYLVTLQSQELKIKIPPGFAE